MTTVQVGYVVLGCLILLGFRVIAAGFAANRRDRAMDESLRRRYRHHLGSVK